MITIQINKLKYNINYVDSNDINLSIDGVPHTGTCLMTGGEIYICNEMVYEVTRRTIIHELTHAYTYAYGHGKRKDYRDEDVCEFMSAFADSILYDTEAILKHYGIMQEESEEEENKE